MNLKSYVISGLIVSKNMFHQYLCLGRVPRVGAGRGLPSSNALFFRGALAEPVITFFSIVSIFNSRYDMNTVESALES